MTDLCTICGFDTEPDNLIVYCSSCNMGVHQTCYGISEVGCKSDGLVVCLIRVGIHDSLFSAEYVKDLKTSWWVSDLRLHHHSDVDQPHPYRKAASCDETQFRTLENSRRVMPPPQSRTVLQADSDQGVVLQSLFSRRAPVHVGESCTRTGFIRRKHGVLVVVGRACNFGSGEVVIGAQVEWLSLD